MRGRRSEFCLLEQMAAESGSQEQTKGIINKTHESECPRSVPLAPSNPDTLRQPLYKQDFLSHKGPLWACVHRGGVDAFPVHRKQFQRPCPKERSDKADASRSCSSALEVTVPEWKIRNSKERIMPQHMTRQGLWNLWVWFFRRPYLLVVWSYQAKYFWGLRQCSSEKWNPVYLGCYVEPAGFCWGVCVWGLPKWWQLGNYACGPGLQHKGLCSHRAHNHRKDFFQHSVQPLPKAKAPRDTERVFEAGISLGRHRPKG